MAIEREPIHPLQAMADGLGAAWQKERAESQMTLGKLIAALEALSPERIIDGFGDLESYRGYYCDLAFEPNGLPRTVASLLADCRKAMGAVFTGYKGGEYMMGASTPLWIAPYGSCGDKLIGLTQTEPITAIVAPDE